MYDSKPIVIGGKGQRMDWSPLLKRMEERLGQTLPLGSKLSQDELRRLGFSAASAHEIR